MTSHHSAPDRIYLTEAKLASLRAHILRTGVAVPALLKAQEKETQGITYKIVYDWLTGRVKSADAKHYKILVKIYKKLPDENENYAEISEELLLKFKKEKARTGVSAKKIFQTAENIPKGLTVFHVENLTRGLVKKTRREYLEFLLSEWKKYADAPIRISITSEMLAHMLQEKERTGIGPMALLHGTKKDRPQGLTTSLMDSWLAGKTKSARKDHLDYVFERWRKLPGSKKSPA
ncbi:MAG: hypothetical protein IPO54_06125 [Micavibrio sp.]|nr:hypothetical protein [Micavibrio sp.]